MDPVNDVGLANEIIEKFREDLDIKEFWRLDLIEKFNDLAHPNDGKMEFDIKFFKRLNPKEFKSVIGHEFYHVLNLNSDWSYAFQFALLFLIILYSLINFLDLHEAFTILISIIIAIIIPLLVITLRNRPEEYKADQFAVEKYPDGRNSLISALEITMEIHSTRGFNLLRTLSHPKTKDRIKRLKTIKLNKKSNVILS
jgi:Zn-dependent protease with chaperone function